MRKLIVLGVLFAALSVLADDSVGIVRREPLANARLTFEKTGKGRVAFLGGSITQMEGWRVKVMAELQRRFPKTTFTFVCAGLSSTCSDTGAYRLSEHLYAGGAPDLVFVEYAVNDSGDGYYLKGRHDPATYDRHALRGVEGVIRGIRERNRRTDIVMTFFTTGVQLEELRAGKTPKTYGIDGSVARRYNVTTVSVGEALAAAEKEGSFDWKRYGGDCHPNADGCTFIFDLYKRLFDAEWNAETPVAANYKWIPIPEAIDPFSYSRGFFLDFGQVTCGEGWKVAPVDWTKVSGNCRPDYRAGDMLVSDTVGATCSFEFKGTAVGAFVLAGPDTGSLEVSIDGGAFVKYEMFSPYSKGSQERPGLHYPFVETFADELPYARHKVDLRVGADRNAASTGNVVRIYRLCANGTDVRGKIPAVHLTEPRAYTNEAGKVLLYRWAQPKKIDPAKKYPLVILFHGAGERGNNNRSQLAHGATDLLNYMDAKGIEAYFVAGQCPGGKQWVDTPWTNTSHVMSEKPSETMALAMELIARMRQEPTVDLSRVFVTGISMGGYGTWDIVQRRPDWFAAALPCCGGGDTAQAARIRNVPIWTFHGDKDGAVPVNRSRDMTAALEAVGGNIRYREYPGAGHGVWGETYANWNEVLDWFFAQRRPATAEDVGFRTSGVELEGATAAETERRDFADGWAVRYRLPAGEKAVRDERTEWTLPLDATVWYQTCHWAENIGAWDGSYESLYVTSRVRDLVPGARLALPVTVEIPDGSYRLLTEANVVGYPDAALEYRGNGTFAVRPLIVAGKDAKTSAATTPWRVTLVAKDLQTLATSDIVRRLCPAPAPSVAERCATFVRPGRCVWQWLPAGAPVYAEQKDWYDRTKDLGFEYYLIDDGWRFWRDGDKDQWACLKAAIDYGKSVGVATFVWVDSKEMLDAASRKDYLDKVAAAGAVGIKIDFIPAPTVGTMRWYEETLQDTLDHRLMTDFHGCVKPSGREKTWPHEVAREAIRGHEWHVTRYNRVLPPEHDCILPFNRLVQGHADYTPVVFEPKQLVRYTWPRQLAQGIVFSAPFLCFGDYPRNYQENPMTELLRALPATYDETRVLPGSAIGKCVVLAKRKGKDWFLAVENGAGARTLSVDLSFLNGEAKMLAFSDDPSGRLDACVKEERTVRPDETLTLTVRSCGGYVARFAPAKK